MTNYYPDAVQKPLTGHSDIGTLAQKTEITLHDTEGWRASDAYNTFVYSVHPTRTSAHFIIDRDLTATVYQLLPLSDVAFHASQVNHCSIGIEHVGIGGKLMCTDVQYQASAKLVAWLCANLCIPCDRQHIRTHNEASPADHHVMCCTGALDPDRVVALANAVKPAS